jgi:Barstar (barnase inhibitor)
MLRIRIDGSQLRDWHSFHSTFAGAFGFPDFCGRNMDAWIDCMTSLDAPDDGLTTIHGTAGDPVILQLDNADTVPKEINKDEEGEFVWVEERRSLEWACRSHALQADTCKNRTPD